MPEVNLKHNGDPDLRVALVHYWHVRRRGGERVLEVLGEMFPQADLFMLVYDPGSLSNAIKAHKITGSFLQKLPRAHRYHRALLPLYPLALEQLRLDEYDLVISQESGPAKGVITRADACHICYCHTPMRYLWDMYHEYLSMAPFGFVGRGFYSLACHYVRQWDYATAARVDHFVASSQNGANRIRKYYGRGSDVIYPPVQLDSFSVANEHDDFYLVVSPLVAYKRIDLAVEACNTLGRRLMVIGDGPEKSALMKIAGPTVTFLGFQTDGAVRAHYRRCRAFLFPGEEDIGLTPIEAQASGRPVIAYGRGGAVETVAGFYPGEDVNPEEATGVFFAEQSADALVDAVLAFETVETKLSAALIRAQVERFDVGHFKEKLGNFVAEKINDFSHLAERSGTRTTAELARKTSASLK
jgi:glycosyltransferase involved in cell wall biosynthesis